MVKAPQSLTARVVQLKGCVSGPSEPPALCDAKCIHATSLFFSTRSGVGYVCDVDPSDPRRKPYEVMYDGGSRHRWAAHCMHVVGAGMQ